jgi:hypothetical protein
MNSTEVAPRVVLQSKVLPSHLGERRHDGSVLLVTMV